jgi:2,3-diketo-5-methylthio-1-phosphopentane phosphatase
MKPSSQYTDIVVFCDFDGTITLKDLGDEVFQHFGTIEPYHTDLMQGKYTVAEYWQKVCTTLPSDCTREAIREFALQQETDAYIQRFVEYCQTQDIPFIVVSDGFDAYIQPILEREGLGDSTVYANMLQAQEEALTPRFPWADEACSCFCASCKRNSLLRNTRDETLVVYIGDGHSDTCAAEHADVIFAKKHLAAYCNKHRLPHYPFSSFFDVLTIFRSLVEKTSQKRLRIRHQALLKRREAFMVE